MRIIKINTDRIKKLNRADVIDYCKKNVLNGEYIHSICFNCGAYKVYPNCNTEDFIREEVCKDCIEI